MNTSRLQRIFANYIEKFEMLNNKKNDETYKWAIVQSFQDGFDVNAPNFTEMLTKAWKKTANLIDNKTQLPFYALIDYSQNEPDTVRDLFVKLYEDDEGDLVKRQSKITAFISSTEELRKKYRPDSWRYINDQRAVMTYLFLHDPEHNYLYKSTQAHEFADCVEFFNDWGSGNNLKLQVYYKMCDELVEIMRSDTALINTNKSRFEKDARRLYPDAGLHILAFDIIYSSQVYGLYDGIEYSHPDSKEKRLYVERVSKAQQLKEAYSDAQSDADKLSEILSYLRTVITAGTFVEHKAFGRGIIEDTADDILTIHFPLTSEKKRFSLLTALSYSYIIPEIPEINKYINDNNRIMRAEKTINAKLRNAEKALEPYWEFL